MKSREEMLKELVERLNATEDYNDVDEAQDRKDLVDDTAIEVVQGQGFTGQSEGDGNEEFDAHLEFLRDQVRFVPARWVGGPDPLETLAEQVAHLDVDQMEDEDEMRRALLVIKGKALEALNAKEA